MHKLFNELQIKTVQSTHLEEIRNQSSVQANKSVLLNGFYKTIDHTPIWWKPCKQNALDLLASGGPATRTSVDISLN